MEILIIPTFFFLLILGVYLEGREKTKSKNLIIAKKTEVINLYNNSLLKNFNPNDLKQQIHELYGELNIEIDYNRAVALQLKKDALEGTITNSKCPSCRSLLVIRKNNKTNTLFLGCRRFPICKYTEGYQLYG